MVIVQSGHNGWARLYLRGPYRGVMSTAIRSHLPVRRWVKATSETPGHWEIPEHAINSLREFLGTKYPRVILIIETSAQRTADSFAKYTRKLKRLQTLGLKDSDDLGINVAGFTGTMPPFQQAGVRYLNFALTKYKGNKSVLLGDVVGLGKTVQVIAEALHLRNTGRIDLVLCVVPASIKIKWSQEIEKFTEEPWIILQTTSQCKGEDLYQQQFMDPSVFFFIINYDIIHRMKDDLISLMNSGKTLMVLDECQYIKNTGTLRTKAATSLGEEAEYVIEMSATFLENTVVDLFNVFGAMNSAILGTDLWHFQRRFVKFDYLGSPEGFKNLPELHKIISPFIIRRRKEQVRGQLAGLIADQIVETDIYVTLTTEHRRIYNEVRAGIVKSLKDLERADKIKHAQLLALITYLRQAALSTALVDADVEVSSKLNYLIEFIEGFDPESKIVIFCYFTKMVDDIAKRLAGKGYSTFSVHGKNTTKGERANIVNRFLVDDTRILVASDVLRVGQDLYSAAYLVNFDLLWNPRAMDQRKGRIDRVGQQNEILYMYNLIAEDTIEERMMEVIGQKNDLFTELAESGGTDTRLTLKRLKGLLEMELSQ